MGGVHVGALGRVGLEDPGRVALLGVAAAASLAYAVVPGLGGGLGRSCG